MFRANMDALGELAAAGLVRAAYPVGPGGPAASLAVMAFGNMAGVEAAAELFCRALGPARQGSALVEIDGKAFSENGAAAILKGAGNWIVAARTLDKPVFRITGEEAGGEGETGAAEIPLPVLRRAYEYPLAGVYPQTSTGATVVEARTDGAGAVVSPAFWGPAGEEEIGMRKCISEWLSEKNITTARGKSREEIFLIFGNELKPVFLMSAAYVPYLDPEIRDNHVYCGMGYFLDHAVNHHPEVEMTEYTKIQDIINEPDDVKLDDRHRKRRAIVFIKKYKKHGTLVIGIGKAKGDKLVFYKSFFNNTKNPYPRLRSIRVQTSLVDGLSTISHTDTSAPAGSLSALNDRFSITNAAAAVKAAPLVALPVFPGTNCEWDMERAFREAGARTRLVIFRNRNREDIAASIRELAAAIGEAQILALSGGFSAGDEPEGSGKFIASVLRAPAAAGAVMELLEQRDGLILGICNGFQALIKLGLVPYGTYRKADETMPTLTFNRIGRHVSRMVRTRVMSTASPWLALEDPGALHILPVSHGEGRLVIRQEEGEGLFRTGQVPFCYADAEGRPALAEPDNPNGSDFAMEGLTSPDGRILGKMAHSERRGDFVHINIPGNKRQNIFEAGIRYFL
jgi:phosphoribosylformylglycinamidine (FGAM) synthase-like amidotransferase family enzyme